MDEIFENRREAGQKLGDFLLSFDLSDQFIFGIARGGMVVAAEVAKKLSAPRDVIVVKKLGMPFDPELAFGALAPEGVMYINQELIERFDVTSEQIKEIEKNARAELDQRIEAYRGTEDYPKLEGKTAILIDDGIATGATARVAIAFLGKLNPKTILVATAVCPPDIYDEIRGEADQVVALETPADFISVGQFYLDFPQVTDEEVTELLR